MQPWLLRCVAYALKTESKGGVFDAVLRAGETFLKKAEEVNNEKGERQRLKCSCNWLADRLFMAYWIFVPGIKNALQANAHTGGNKYNRKVLESK